MFFGVHVALLRSWLCNSQKFTLNYPEVCSELPWDLFWAFLKFALWYSLWTFLLFYRSFLKARSEHSRKALWSSLKFTLNFLEVHTTSLKFIQNFFNVNVRCNQWCSLWISVEFFFLLPWSSLWSFPNFTSSLPKVQSEFWWGSLATSLIFSLNFAKINLGISLKFTVNFLEVHSELLWNWLFTFSFFEIFSQRPW